MAGNTNAKRARVLVACTLAGRDLAPNDLIAGPAAVIAAAEKAGQVDTSEQAVAHVAETLKRSPVDLSKTEATPER